MLRHESVKPSSVEQGHSPLFRHESISIGNNHHETPRKPSVVTPPESPPIPEEADASDDSLLSFPSDHEGILNEIQEATKRSELNGIVPEVEADTTEVEIEVCRFTNRCHSCSRDVHSPFDKAANDSIGGNCHRDRGRTSKHARSTYRKGWWTWKCDGVGSGDVDRCGRHACNEISLVSIGSVWRICSGIMKN